ncbi:MAG TPA: threonine aldolase family protein [Gammaproteobacteria bacterium]|nr:threonine aldolase family protein [Gammaproteobacteria bacterium]
MFQGIDLSSDTATKPTDAMKAAMMNALLGDEQKDEDPTTLELQKMTGDMLGFDHALFLPSATMANQIAISALCNPGEVVLAAENAHIFLSESGGPAVHAGVVCRAVPALTGTFTADQIKKQDHWQKNYRHPAVTLISIENTVNFSGGISWKKEELDSVVNYAKKRDIHLHLDGSRLFNASIRTGLSSKEICKGFDTVTLCLSKGLGCPMGALIAFNKKHYLKIRHLKFLMGGAMRQTGMIAAAGIYALKNNIDRLNEDHKNAQLFSNELTKFDSHIRVVTHSPETNMVLFDWIFDTVSSEEFVSRCLKNNLRFSRMSENRFRAVTHLDVIKEDIIAAANIIADICC